MTYAGTLHKILNQQLFITIAQESGFLQICSSCVHVEFLDSSCTAAQTHFFVRPGEKCVLPLAAPNMRRRLRSCLSIFNDISNLSACLFYTTIAHWHGGMV